MVNRKSNRGGYPSINNNTILVNSNILNNNQAEVLSGRFYGISSRDAVITTKSRITRIHAGTFKAHRGHYIDASYRINTGYKETLLNELLEGIRASLGLTRFHKSKYRQVLDCTIANLVHTAKYSLSLVYSRDGTREAIQRHIIDYLASIGMIHSIIGKANEFEHNSSWCVASAEFKLLVEKHKVQQVFKKGAMFAQVRERKKRTDKTRKVIPQSKWKATPKQLNLINAAAFAHNHFWLDHTITIDGSPLSPYIFRSFTESLDLGGRFYGRVLSPQALKREQRPNTCMDDVITAELDFDSLHPHLLYAMIKQQMTIEPYEFEGYTRNTGKAALLRLINSEDIRTWLRNISESAKQSNKDAGCILVKGEATKGFIKNIPSDCIATDLLNALKAAHAPIAHLFGTPDLGLKLQRLDSEIMSKILIACSSQGIAAYPIHDSVICKDSDKQIVREIMHRTYKSVTGFSIGITEKKKP